MIDLTLYYSVVQFNRRRQFCIWYCPWLRLWRVRDNALCHVYSHSRTIQQHLTIQFSRYDRIVDIEFFIDGKDKEANFKQSHAIIVNGPVWTGSTRDRDIVSIGNHRARGGSMEKKINGLTSFINKLSHAIPYQILPRKSAWMHFDNIRRNSKLCSTKFKRTW